MFTKIRRIFKSISTKIILVIIFLVLPLNLIAILESNTVINNMVAQTRISSKNFADTYMSEIGTRMMNTQSLLNYFQTENSDFIRMRLQKEDSYTYQSSKYKFFYSLKSLASMTDGGDGYFYHMKKLDDTLVYDSSPVQSSQFYRRMNEFITEQLKIGIKSGWHIYDISSKRYLILIINSKDVVYGGWMNLDNLEAKLEKVLDYSDFSVSFTEEIKDLTDNKWITVSSGKKGIYLNISLKRSEILGGISVYHKILQIMVFVYLILIPALYVFMRFLVIRPLNKINYAHRQIQGGNQEFRISQKANSVEFQEAYQSFNHMADNLKTLKIDSYEKELTKRKMELRNLQLQIRPHFLLNTFNLIYTLAQRKEIIGIQDIILYLSDYFRYIFRNDKELDIFSKELKLIEGYMKMVSIRYSGNIEVIYEFDPEIRFIRLPSLLIHNFIENAVKYGLKLGIILHVTIQGLYSNNLVTFYITDDGNGMDEETLEKSKKLLRGETLPDNPNKHIGLLNSIRRLRYFYGDEANIEITSEQGVMTRVKIQFPYYLEVDDETINGQ